MILIAIRLYFKLTVFAFSISACLTELSLNFKNDNRFDNFVLNHGLLSHTYSDSLVSCARKCIEDKSCIAFHFNQGKLQCRGYETLMLTSNAGAHEEGWQYYYITIFGLCPSTYAFSRAFNYCLGYEGLSLNDEGREKCYRHGGNYILIRGADENRFASLLAYNFRHLDHRNHRQLMIQGHYDDVEEKWKDDSGIPLLFTQFVDDKYKPKHKRRKLYLEQTDSPENFLMSSRRGNVHPAITVCTTSI